jgi:phage shock protein PspC (stress-responsive transcriptional regulator)
VVNEFRSVVSKHANVRVRIFLVLDTFFKERLVAFIILYICLFMCGAAKMCW